MAAVTAVVASVFSRANKPSVRTGVDGGGASSGIRTKFGFSVMAISGGTDLDTRKASRGSEAISR